jgi:hypothetical protein
MEKISNSKNLLNSLGALVSKKIKVIAQDKKDHISLEDDAVEHAKAYRMLGWSWDQIDTILEDMEFEPEIVKCSIKSAQRYFEDTQKDGAFSMFVLGQLIKLTNGYVGKVLDKYPTKLQIKLFDSNEEILVSEAQIDLDASLKLKEAFVLRTTANELLRASDEELFADVKIEVAGSKTLCAMAGSVIKKIAAALAHINSMKESFKDNKVVLSSLGLEYYALVDLSNNMTPLKNILGMPSDVQNYASVMTTITAAADVLDQFTNERSILASHTIAGDDANTYADKTKKIVAAVDQTVIPNLVKVSTELLAAVDALAKEQTKQRVSAVVDKINKV